MPSRDWRSAAAYAELENASARDLAWEFLRRNPRYVRDWEQLATRGPTTRPTPSPSAGGCDFPADPALDARTAGVVWMPALCTATVALSALPPSFSPRSPAALPPASSPRQASDGLHGAVGEPPIPVWLSGGASPDTHLGALIPLDDALPQRLAAVLRLWHALRGRAQSDPGVTALQRRRLVLTLRAHDGHHAGHSYREIAVGLFGAARVPRGAAWKAHDLRARTMRLVADAIRLRDGGYRALLRIGPRVTLTR
jgi:hypothetical protein